MNQKDLTKGSVFPTMCLFALPMILGNILQQGYNIVDTWVVGHFAGPDALGAVGSAFALMTFLTSVLLGLCMGSGVVFSLCFGRQDEKGLADSTCASFLLESFVAVPLTAGPLLSVDGIIAWMNIPAEIVGITRDYLVIIFWGIPAVALYNFFGAYLKALGNSVIPLIFLGISTLLNIGLDILLVAVYGQGTAGAAAATIVSQYIPAMGMAAFAAAVKIDAFAYMPVQEYGNAFSTFIAQNAGARQDGRIRKGIRYGVATVISYCALASLVLWFLARPLMLIFINSEETEIVAEGVRYLHTIGPFYFGIGCLFLFYGLYRALGRPAVSVVLTVISLGTRVALSYTLSAVPEIGVRGIWWSIPIGWGLADLAGLLYYLKIKNVLFREKLQGTTHL